MLDINFLPPPRRPLEQKSFLFFFTPLIDSSAFLIAAVASTALKLACSSSLLAIGSALFATSAGLKIAKTIDNESCKMLLLKLLTFDKKYPKLQLIFFLFTLAISLKFFHLGILMGATAGIYGALILETKRCQRLQNIPP